MNFVAASRGIVVDILRLFVDDVVVLEELALEAVLLSSVGCQTTGNLHFLLCDLEAQLLRKTAHCHGCHSALVAHYLGVLSGGHTQLAELRSGRIHLHGGLAAGLLFKHALPFAFLLVALQLGLNYKLVELELLRTHL